MTSGLWPWDGMKIFIVSFGNSETAGTSGDDHWMVILQ